jgi:ATP-dependent helicase/nuclease subunit B
MRPLENCRTQIATSDYFGFVARQILEKHAPPDLRGATVLLPNYHAAQTLAQALSAAADVPALLLPRMITLSDWAQSVPLETPVQPDTQRIAALYQALRERRWFGQADLWGMTQELLILFDELTLTLDALPANADEFANVVQQAYQARQNEALQLEARLVFELWHAMKSGAELDAVCAYQRRLALLAQQADRPMFVLQASERDELEQRFLDEYAQRAEVKVFDVREMEAKIGVPRYFAATSLEQEARVAAMQIRLWLSEGKQNIVVVVQDRVVARRLRALLERAEVLVADETGWTFATLSVSTVLDRWLTALQSDFYHHDLLDLLKSPFIFADMPASERKATVYQLEQLLRKNGVVAGLENFIALSRSVPELHQPLSRLRQATDLLDRNKKRSLPEWLGALHKTLDALGIAAGLQQDDAGQQLLHALDAWHRELKDDGGRYAFPEWRRWLAQQLDTETYRDIGIDSPVCFTHLAATRWRAFDAVLLLGCDADHLPGMVDGGRWFNDAVRAALNLPTRSRRAARQRDDLHALLALNDCVLATWQKEQDGEARLLSPFLQILRDENLRAHGAEPTETGLLAYLAAEDLHSVALPLAARPEPGVPAEDLPESISVSAYNSLVACPYQFHARYILRLNELDEVQEAIEKRDYGERVHDILRRFHERYPQVSGHPGDEMETALRQISETVFSDLLAQDFAARAWLERWYKSLPAYLEWQTGNEAQGWHYDAAESDLDLKLDGISLRGRIDRIDRKEKERLVLDYKTQSDQVLRNKLKEPGEDVQLACYAYAKEANEAAFVSIENGKVKTVSPPHDVAQLAQLNVGRLESVTSRIRTGATLPANGIDQACVYCEMRGVCRKGMW